ncbi:MAG: ATP-grasp domain-containing protein [Kiritimatiellae bacterium]|nr:ATP-grasp domain-containing protein [Kiritimatiellia bacterium]
MSNHLPPAFVTYGWCRTAYTVVRSLGARGVDVHVGDSSPLAMSRASRFAKSFTRLPDFFTEPEAYVEALGTAMLQRGAKVLFPCHEDVEAVIRFRDKLPADICVALPSFEDWSTAEDKLNYVDAVRTAGCPVPETYQVRTSGELTRLRDTLSFPVVIKTRIGNSAKGVEIIRERSQLEPAFYRLVQEYKLPPDRWPTLQVYVPGTKQGVLGVYQHGKHVSSIVFDIIRSKGSANFGTSTFRVTLDDPELKANAIKAMEALNWHGVVDMDWLRDDEGTARLIDINGRLGGATALTYISGMDMPWLWYQIAIGEKSFDIPQPRVGAKARWILGDVLGLLDSLRNGKLREVVDVLTPQWKCGHDDWVWNDPLPFVFQFMDYAAKFLKAGGNMNPIGEGMIR